MTSCLYRHSLLHYVTQVSSIQVTLMTVRTNPSVEVWVDLDGQELLSFHGLVIIFTIGAIIYRLHNMLTLLIN